MYFFINKVFKTTWLPQSLLPSPAVTVLLPQPWGRGPKGREGGLRRRVCGRGQTHRPLHKPPSCGSLAGEHEGPARTSPAAPRLPLKHLPHTWGGHGQRHGAGLALQAQAGRPSSSWGRGGQVTEETRTGAGCSPLSHSGPLQFHSHPTPCCPDPSCQVPCGGCLEKKTSSVTPVVLDRLGTEEMGNFILSSSISKIPWGPVPCKLSVKPSPPSLQGAGRREGLLVSGIPPLPTPAPSASHLPGWNAGQIDPGVGVARSPVDAPSQPPP